ncbi:Nn.00g004180.m01.CDS01 [Neocucurbitaria sp. VM-36]
MYRIPSALARPSRGLCARLQVLPQTAIRQSSGSPTAGKNPPDHFNKTGEKEQDPADFSSRSYEYSQSGGDDIVAGQAGASFKDSKDTDPASQKVTAGKGNVVNPLELSPATPELSKYFDDTDVSKSADREPGAKTGQGVSLKGKRVEKNKIDFK